jgi:DNA-directed RNA polymerase specialized sigma24 family protein
VLRWLLSDEARIHAQRSLRKFDLPADLAGDVIHDTWLDINATFNRRTDPYPDLQTEHAVARYTKKSVTNNVVDRVRKASHRHERPILRHHRNGDDDNHPNADDAYVASNASDDDQLDDIDNKHLALQLRASVARRAEHNAERCHGCDQSIVLAVALYVCNAAGASNEVVEDHLDDLIYQGLKVNDPTTFAGHADSATAAQRQKKSRCGRCIKTLLRNASGDIGMTVST